jgi:hypothetical protein
MSIEKQIIVPKMTDSSRANIEPTAQLSGEYRGNLAELIPMDSRRVNVEPTAQLIRSRVRDNLAIIISNIRPDAA